MKYIFLLCHRKTVRGALPILLHSLKLRSAYASTASLGRDLNHSPESRASVNQDVGVCFYEISLGLKSLLRSRWAAELVQLQILFFRRP